MNLDKNSLLISFLLCLLAPYCLGSTEDCIRAINSVTSNITMMIFQNQTLKIMDLPLIAYSGKDLNNLGSYQLCQSSPNASYITLHVSIHENSQDGVIGLCGPLNCTAQDYQNNTVQNAIQTLLNIVGPIIQTNITALLENTTITAVDPNPYPSVTASSWVAFLFVGISISLALISSGVKLIIDRMTKKFSTDSLILGDGSYMAMKEAARAGVGKKNAGLRILECWAIQDNLKRLFYPEVNPKHDTNLHIFNGVRFISMCWILLGHEYDFRPYYIQNYKDIPMLLGDKFLNFVAAGFFSVDTFFYLGGFSGAFVLYSKLKHVKISIVAYGGVLLHRIIRILPVYAFVILLYWKISVYLGNGPIWESYINWASGCDNDWWKSMLFINNWFKSMNCADWGWYLNCDMQMFLLSPFIVWLYLKRASFGLIITALLTLASLSLGMYYSFKYNVMAGALQVHPGDWLVQIYRNPLVRVPPYLVGTALALIYRSTKEGRFLAPFDLIKSSQIISWIIELSGVALISLLIWLPVQVQDNPSNWSPWFHHVFMALNKFLFSIGLTMILLPTLAGAKTAIRGILSAGFWAPLATLVFGMYLIHILILTNYIYSEKSTFYLSDPNLLVETISLIMVSLFSALILYLVIEAPVGRLETTITEMLDKSAKFVKPEKIDNVPQNDHSNGDSKIPLASKDISIVQNESKEFEVRSTGNIDKSHHLL